MNTLLTPSWQLALTSEFTKPYFLALQNAVAADYLIETVYPAEADVFNAFACTPLENVTVVILGQDPYHGPGQAHGLSFSVPDEVPVPPSLRNIYKEIEADTGSLPPDSGNLERLAAQGVLLLNSTLTVRAGAAGSHQSFGWEQFTDHVIKTISTQKEHVVFMLWGAFAGSKVQFIDTNKHLVLTAPHPSPLSAYRGFFGCKHFSQCNAYLVQNGLKPIKW